MTVRKAVAPARTARKKTITPHPLPTPPSRAMRELHAKYPDALAPIWSPATGLTVTIKVPAKITLAPERTKCRSCQKKFGSKPTDVVVLRMFCSYKCAGLPKPDFNPATAPRECKRAARSDEPGEWVLKQRFTTPEEAAPYLKPGTQVYRCSNCFFLHIGNTSAPPAKRGLPAPPTGGDLFSDSVQAVLRARGEDDSHPAAVAAAKRDVRAVFDTIRAHQGR